MDFSYRVMNEVALATTLGVSESIICSRTGSQGISQLMSSRAVHELQGALNGAIDEKVSSLRAAIANTRESTKRGVSALAVLRQNDVSVVAVLDALRRGIPPGEDPVTYLTTVQRFPIPLLERLGLHKDMSKRECQEMLGRHLRGVLERIAGDSDVRGLVVAGDLDVRGLVKLAIYGEEHYRNLSLAFKLCSTVANGISNIASKPITLISSAFGRKLSAKQETAAMTGAAMAMVTLFGFTCPPLAIAIAVTFSVYLLFKGIGSLFELADQSFASSCLEGKEGGWSHFLSQLSQGISKTIDDIAPAAAKATMSSLIPGADQFLQVAATEQAAEQVQAAAANVAAGATAAVNALASNVAGQAAQVVEQGQEAVGALVGNVVEQVEHVATDVSEAAGELGGPATSEVPLATIPPSNPP
jgi:hypothetical protein